MRIPAQWLFGNLGWQLLGFPIACRFLPLRACCSPRRHGEHGGNYFFEILRPRFFSRRATKAVPAHIALHTSKTRENSVLSVVNKLPQPAGSDFPAQECRISEKRDRISSQGKAFRDRAATLPDSARLRAGDPGISWKSPNIPQCPGSEGWFVRCRVGCSPRTNAGHGPRSAVHKRWERLFTVQARCLPESK